MKTAIITLAMLSSVAAQAEGFVCTSERDQVAVKVYHHTNPEHGTRNAAVMVISDLREDRGNRTVAKFKDTTLLNNRDGSAYEAKIDLRYTDTNKDGMLLGQAIDELSKIKLSVDFNYNYPLADGESTDGVLTLVKRDGARKTYELNCVRYLKN